MGNPGLQERIVELWLPLLIGQLVLVFAISFLITRISSVVALGLFFVYALTMGLVLGVIVAGLRRARSASLASSRPSRARRPSSEARRSTASPPSAT